MIESVKTRPLFVVFDLTVVMELARKQIILDMVHLDPLACL